MAAPQSNAQASGALPPTAPKVPKIKAPEGYSLASLANFFSGLPLLQRLLFIAEHSDDLLPAAAEMLLRVVKTTSNTVFYKSAIDKLKALNIEVPFDSDWVAKHEHEANVKLEALEQELNAARASMQKEKIFAGYVAAAKHLYERGDLTSALRYYSKSRDHATTAQQAGETYLAIARISLELGNYGSIVNTVSKAEQLKDVPDKHFSTKLKMYTGMANLENRSYKSAARKLLDATSPALADPAGVPARDVAAIGTLCALATYDRQELRRGILENRAYRELLERECPQLYACTNDLIGSRYSQCLANLARMQLELALDLHLHDHVATLCQQIRDKAIVQYFSPYQSVDLKRMAAAFNSSVDDLETELTKLIAGGQIHARIDSQNKIMFARHTDQRGSTFEQVMRTGAQAQAEAEATLLRINLMRSDFCIRTPQSSAIAAAVASATGMGGPGISLPHHLFF
jgi:COP9 signalosome complex subunit 1